MLVTTLLTASKTLFILRKKDAVKIARYILPVFSISAMLLFAQCDKGLEPPDEDLIPPGVIQGTITYSGEWPSQQSLVDLRFVPLTFVPSTAFDIFSDLDNLRFSNRLQYFVEEDSFKVTDVRSGLYVYNIIAHQFGNNILADWQPVGVYTENDGLIRVEGDTTPIHIHVDFDNLPPFPPE